jgi:putative membrane protein
MIYTTIKALHLIFMVTWFAGLFYIVRLFIYHREAIDQPEPAKAILVAQFTIMERRLWYAITWPSAVLCTVFGVTMLLMEPVLLQLGYMHLKLAFVMALLIYQIATHFVFQRFQRNTSPLPSSIRLRFYNEMPTVFLIAVVFIIIKKDSFSWISGLIGILGVAILLTLAIKWYQRLRR